jgi:predicted RNase H-like HicB family nuclease
MSNLKVEVEKEEDGRWIGEVDALPGVAAYGNSPEQAVCNTRVLALRVLADRLENGEALPEGVERWLMEMLPRKT